MWKHGSGHVELPTASGRQCLDCSEVQFHGHHFGSLKYATFDHSIATECSPGDTPRSSLLTSWADKQRASFASASSSSSAAPASTRGKGAIQGKEHRWSELVVFPTGHGRQCVACGVLQLYGKRYETNKYKAFDPSVSSVCLPRNRLTPHATSSSCASSSSECAEDGKNHAEKENAVTEIDRTNEVATDIGIGGKGRVNGPPEEDEFGNDEKASLPTEMTINVEYNQLEGLLG